MNIGIKGFTEAGAPDEVIASRRIAGLSGD
jgi:hypothetical protein